MNDEEKKSTLRTIFTLPLLYIEAVLMMVIGELIGMSIRLLSSLFPMLAGNEVWVTLSDYGEFWGMWLIVMALLFMKKNRPILTLFKKKGFITGLLIGFGMNGFCVLMAALTGAINLSFSSFNIFSFFLLFAAVFIQSGAEEIVCRAFLYERLRKAYKSPFTAIIGNSVLFALLHSLNDGVGITGIMNTFVIALLLSAIIYYYGSFWCVAALHTAWNFTQNILFGLPNSGNIEPYSIFSLSSGAKNSFFYDTAFGIEGSIFSSLVIIVVILILVLYANKHDKREVYIWTE